jgi:hypothetical protein
VFEQGNLASFMRKPLTFGQGLSFDTTLGTTTGTYQIESMRSQKVIALAPLRIEVHDRSGEPDCEKAQIPETMVALANVLGIERVRAIGANWEIMFKLPGKISASAAISEKLLREDVSFFPPNMTSMGGAVRLFLADPSGVYTLAIEPRGQIMQTDDVWMTCNLNVSYPESLSIELLKEMFQKSYHMLFQPS